jgi:hypothetical protein
MSLVLFFCIVAVLAVGLVVWMWRISLQRMETRLLERMETTQRGQPRSSGPTHHAEHPHSGGMVRSEPAPPAHHTREELMEIDAIPQDIFERECADVLSQIAHRRKQFRRPTTRRRRTPID